MSAAVTYDSKLPFVRASAFAVPASPTRPSLVEATNRRCVGLTPDADGAAHRPMLPDGVPPAFAHEGLSQAPPPKGTL